MPTDDHLDVYKILRSNIFPQNRLTLVYSSKTSDISAGPSGACLTRHHSHPHPHPHLRALGMDSPLQLLCLSTCFPISGAVLLGPNGFLWGGGEKVQRHSIVIGSRVKDRQQTRLFSNGESLPSPPPATRLCSDPLTLHGSPLLTRLYKDL